MGTILFAVSAACALWGVLLVIDFLSWRAGTEVVTGAIEDFQAQKNLWSPLPVVSAELEDGTKHTLKAERIDQLGYYLSDHQAGEYISVVVKKSEPPVMRVFGFLGLGLGLMLLLQFVAVTAYLYGQTLFAGQAAYALIFGFIIVGGLLFLRFIRNSY